MNTVRIPIAVLAVAAAMACSPDSRVVGPYSAAPLAARSGIPFDAGLASPVWQAKAGNLVAQAGLSPPVAGHVYPILGVAQYLAVQEAEAAAGNSEDSDGGRS